MNDLHYKKCSGYNENTSMKKILAGSTGGNPIYIEKEVVTDVYCSLNKTGSFDCSTCLFYAQIKNDK